MRNVSARDAADLTDHTEGIAMSGWEFRAPSLIITGWGSFAAAGEQAARLGRRAVIISDPVMARLGLIDRLQSLLAERGVESFAYTGVTGEPTDGMVNEGLDLLQQKGGDLVIALGGGSPIDTAKAVAMLAVNGGKITDYMGQNKVGRPGLPLICLPTTAGTGSEVTRFTIITDTVNDVKMLIGSPYLIPTVAIVDAELTVSSPRRVTADTGVDALTHAIEAYISRRRQPLTDVLALQAVSRISRNLVRAWTDGSDRAAREEMMLGSMEAGLAFSNASVALVHGMSRPIGAIFHVPHGLSNALLLPSVMRFSLPDCADRYARIAAAMGCETAGLSEREAAERALSAVERLCREVQIPTAAAAGVEPEKLRQMAPKMASDALASGSPANNPRVPTREEIIELYLSLV